MPEPTASQAPLLAAEDLRVDVDGVPVCDGVTFATTGSRVLVVGAPRALALAAMGLTPAVRGRLSIDGVAAEISTKDAASAGAPIDMPLPPKWNVREYVAWSARLAGQGTSDANASADRAIAELQLGELAVSRCDRLVPHARRATVVAAALATHAKVLVLEDPFAGLPDDVARTFASILLPALASRAWVVFAAHVPVASPLALAADEAIVMTGDDVAVTQGTPSALAASEKRYVARFVAEHEGAVEALASRLRERGADVKVEGVGPSARVRLDLGAAVSTAELLAMCASAEVVLVELLPTARAFA